MVIDQTLAGAWRRREVETQSACIVHGRDHRQSFLPPEYEPHIRVVNVDF